MEIVDYAIHITESSAKVMPLELFVLITSFLDDIVLPVPAPLVLIIAGSIAKAQNYIWPYIFFLAVLGAIGKTIASIILYYIGDKGEDVALKRFGKFFGLSHDQIEKIGKKLNKGARDYIFLFLARAIPFIPSVPVSIICGIIKIKMKTYIITTFLGTTVRNIFFLYIGYIGISEHENIAIFLGEGLGGQIMIGGILLFVFLLFLFLKHKNKFLSKEK